MRHQAHVALPAFAVLVDGEGEIDVLALLPVVYVVLVGEVRGVGGAVEDAHARVVGAVLQGVLDGGLERRRADAAHDEEYLLALPVLYREAAAHGGADAHLVALAEVCRALVTSPAFMTLNWMNSRSLGLVVMAKVLSPTPKMPSWPTWPGRKLKFFWTSGSSKRMRKVLMVGVSSMISTTVATSGRYGLPASLPARAMLAAGLTSAAVRRVLASVAI